MHAATTISLVVGISELVLAVVVARHLLRFGRRFPWLLALMAFFALRGATRVAAAFVDADSSALVLAFDGLVLAVLVFMLRGLDGTVNALVAAESDARNREEAYDRALRDYQVLARHRLANPITAIRGSAQTLRRRRELDDTVRDELLETIDDEAARLETIALRPVVESDEEQALRPEP